MISGLLKQLIDNLWANQKILPSSKNAFIDSGIWVHDSLVGGGMQYIFFLKYEVLTGFVARDHFKNGMQW